MRGVISVSRAREELVTLLLRYTIEVVKVNTDMERKEEENNNHFVEQMQTEEEKFGGVGISLHDVFRAVA